MDIEKAFKFLDPLLPVDQAKEEIEEKKKKPYEAVMSVLSFMSEQKDSELGIFLYGFLHGILAVMATDDERFDSVLDIVNKYN